MCVCVCVYVWVCVYPFSHRFLLSIRLSVCCGCMYTCVNRVSRRAITCSHIHTTHPYIYVHTHTHTHTHIQKKERGIEDTLLGVSLGSCRLLLCAHAYLHTQHIALVSVLSLSVSLSLSLSLSLFLSLCCFVLFVLFCFFSLSLFLSLSHSLSLFLSLFLSFSFFPLFPLSRVDVVPPQIQVRE